MLCFFQSSKFNLMIINIIKDIRVMLDSARIPIRLPAPVSEWLSPATVVVPGQLFAMHLASTRGYDPDSPRAIRKVTETL